MRDVLFFAALPFIMLLALVTMPIWGPLLAWQIKRDDKRMLAAARITVCERCGRILGPESLARADLVEAEFHAARSEDADWTAMQYRQVRILRAMCVGCDAPYAYSTGSRAFRLLPDNRRLWS